VPRMINKKFHFLFHLTFIQKIVHLKLQFFNLMIKEKYLKFENN